jgi:hypothetical protein
MKNLISIVFLLLSIHGYSQSQRFEYDSINLNNNGVWLPRDIGMKSVIILEERAIRNYTGDTRLFYTIVQRFSKEEINLEEKLNLIIAALVLDEENKEYIIIITDQFTSITDVANQMTFQYTKN